MKKILVIIGTRPEAVKMAPIVKELKKHSERFKSVICVTAQHRDMLDQALDLFAIKPDHDLDIMKANQDLFDITSGILNKIQHIMLQERPDMILVQGDTTTTFVSALAAFYLKIPIGHVEAGLRTFNSYSPFPEEVNRHLTSVLADIHFAPTERSKSNLMREGIAEEKVFITGNTVIDALLATVDKDNNEHCIPVYSPVQDRKMILVTAHRRESFGEPFRNICNALKTIADKNPDVEIVYPVHLNPNVRKPVFDILGSHDRIKLITPQDYGPFARLMSQAYLILTDSGGIQEEAPSLGKPVLVLREMTERPEAVDAGTVKLVGMDTATIVFETQQLLDDNTEYEKMARAINPYGDGKAAQRIVGRLAEYFN